MRELSVIIPAYNEEKRIPSTLSSVAAFLKASAVDAEVLVVDDGSSDRTISVAESMSECFEHLIVVRSDGNFGKGHAVRLGMLAATGRRRLFMDADNSTDLREMNHLLAAADDAGGKLDVVIGSIADSEALVQRPQSWLRRTLGQSANRYIQWAVLPGIEDSQRGFKLFSADAAERIFSRCRVNGWAFDVEVLAVARGLGYRVLEVPVAWTHCDDSKVRPWSYAQSLLEVARIRHALKAGRYHLDETTPADLANMEVAN